MNQLPPSLPYTAAAIVIALAGVALIAFAIFRDRSKGRQRCPKCWYDMPGAAPSLCAPCTCPECGFSITSAKQLLRTRRRWPWAIAGCLVIAVATQLHQQPHRTNEGWTSWVPDIAVAFIPTFWTSEDELPRINSLVDSRIRNMSGWQVRTALWAEGVVYKADWESAIEVRRRWFAGRPLEVTLSAWNANAQSAACGLTCRLTESRSSVAARDYLVPRGVFLCGLAGGSRSDRFVLPAFEAGEHKLRFKLGTAVPRLGHEDVQLKNLSFEIPITVLPTIDDVMPPLKSTAFDAELKKAISIEVKNAPGAVTYFNLKIGTTPPTGTALGLAVELLCADERASAAEVPGNYYTYGAQWHIAGSRGYEFAMDLESWNDKEELSVKRFGRWTLRIRGDQELSLADLNATQYWAGSIELPLADLLKPK